MSDCYYDSLRDAGEYPPKLWGWQSDDYQRKEVERLLGLGDAEAWVLREAKRLGIEVHNK